MRKEKIPPVVSGQGRPEHPLRCGILCTLVWLLLVALDLLTKSAAAEGLRNGPIPLIPGVLEFYYLQNTGAAFSLLENAQWLFILIAVVVVALIGRVLLRIPKTRRFLPMISVLLLISAGAVGNLADRICLGYVRDFIYFSWINFPVFNVADIYVTVSTVLLVLLVLLFYKDEDFEQMLGVHTDKDKS